MAVIFAALPTQFSVRLMQLTLSHALTPNIYFLTQSKAPVVTTVIIDNNNNNNCYIYIALFWALKALYKEGGSHIARTPTTHQLIGGEETGGLIYKVCVRTDLNVECAYA